MDIEKFVELNKEWLYKFEYNSYIDTNMRSPSWWDGDPDWSTPQGLDFTIENDRYFTFINWDVGDNVILEFDTDEFVENKLESFFSDWCKPTKDELDYYEMIHGYRLPWSEEHPFILP